MAYMINDNCTGCDACMSSCPNEAITPGDVIYQIDPERCSECQGAYDQPQCVDVCPADAAIVLDPKHKESKEQLQAKYDRLHGR